jgi:cell division protein FtsA
VVAKTVLTEEDRQSGVALVDIGAGVTSVAIYQGGIMRSYVAIPFGGKTITGDIRSECSIPEDLAEKIKLKFGACMPGKLASLSEKVLQIRLTEPYKEVTVKYISEVIDARAREIIDAVLYYIQESGLENNLRGGIVLTGGGASLVNFANLFKEVSGYEVRIGFPKHLFSAPVGAGVYNPSAAAAIGMILAAKDDKMPDCVTRPEPIWADTPDPEPEVEEETVEESEGFFVPDSTFEGGEQGTLIDADNFGPAEPQEKKPEKVKEPKKPKKPKEPKASKMHWIKDIGSKVKIGVLNFYDEMTREEEDENNLKTEE